MSASINLANIPTSYQPVPSGITSEEITELTLLGYITTSTINGVLNWKSTGAVVNTGTSSSSSSSGNNINTGLEIGNATVNGVLLTTVLSNLLNINTGGTLAAPLYLSGNPTSPYQAATMQYVGNTATAVATAILNTGTVSSNSYLSNAGGTLTGPLILSGAPSTPLQATTMLYVENYVSAEIAGLNFISNTGGTLNGPLTLHADPVLPLQAATMEYVENTITSAIGSITSNGTVSVTNGGSLAGNFTVGGTLFSLGALLLSADPTLALEPATNQMLDTRIKRFNSIAALRAFPVTSYLTSQQAVTPITADVQNYYPNSNGGGGLFDYNATSILTDDGCTVIAPSSGSGRWLRRNWQAGLYPEMAGALGNYSYSVYTTSGSGIMGSTNVVSDDTNAFMTLASLSASLGGLKIRLTSYKRYLITNFVFFTSGSFIAGPTNVVTNGSQGGTITISATQIVNTVNGGLVFQDGVGIRNVIMWYAGTPENPQTLSAVRNTVNNLWATGVCYNQSETITSNQVTPQGYKGGLSCMISVNSVAGLYQGWAVSDTNGALPVGAKIQTIYSAVFTGTISNTTLTVSSITSGSLAQNNYFTGTNVSAGTYITGPISVNSNGIGTYSINQAQNITTSTVFTSNNIGVTLGAFYGSIPVGTSIFCYNPGAAIQFQGDGLCENVLVIGGHTGIAYSGNALIKNSSADVAGVGFEAVNNGANGYLDCCRAFSVWSNNCPDSSKDAYGNASTRPGVGFQSYVRGGSTTVTSGGYSNTGQTWMNCVAENYVVSMYWCAQFGAKVFNFGPETAPNNNTTDTRVTFGLLAHGDCRINEVHGMYWGGSGIGLGLYHNTLEGAIDFHGGNIIGGSSTSTFPIVDFGPGCRTKMFGCNVEAEGPCVLLNFDANVGFCVIEWPSLAGGSAYWNIPTGAENNVFIIQGDFQQYSSTSTPVTFIVPRLPTTAPSQPNSIYRGGSGANVPLMIV